MFSQERTKVTQLPQQDLVKLLIQEFKVTTKDIRFVIKSAEEEYSSYPRQIFDSVVITKTELLKDSPHTEQIIKTTITAAEFKQWILKKTNSLPQSQVSFELKSLPDDGPGFPVYIFSHATISEKN